MRTGTKVCPDCHGSGLVSPTMFSITSLTASSCCPTCNGLKMVSVVDFDEPFVDSQPIKQFNPPHIGVITTA